MRHSLTDFTVGNHDATRVAPDGWLTLSDGATGGTWTSPLLPADPFDEAIPSWNALTPDRAWLEVRLRLRLDDGWTTWYTLGRWGTSIQGGSVAGQRDADGDVEIDTLRTCGGCTDAFQVQVRLGGDSDSGAPPVVRDVEVWTHVHGSCAPLPAAPHPAWGRVLNVPERSQMVEPADVRGHICSPTSLGMLLAYHGVQRTTLQVCDGVYDHGAGIWGNWPFNTAYVYPVSAGRLVGHVERWDNLRHIEDEIAAGRPVVLSHRWEEGDLANAPIPRSNGHLIVVVGFDANGDVVVNDPAANPLEGQRVRRVYRRADVERTWLERASGVVYTARPA